MASLAVVRQVPSSYAQALSAHAPDEPVDVARARAQHAAYRAALTACGVSVIDLPADEAHPDCCFVEDTAVIAAGIAIVTHPGAPSRRGEVDAIASELEGRVRVVRMAGPATLDGGDCMRVGALIFVGHSARTNQAGIARMITTFEPHGFRIVPVELPAGILHLKSVCAPLGEDRITLAEGMPRDAFADLDIVAIPAAETYAANVLAIGDRVLVSAGYPRTLEALSRADYSCIPLEMSEFRKADGALTCLSLLL